MFLKVYSVYDSKAQAFLPPFFARADGEAVRACKAAVSDPNHQFFAHAADYTLFGIGEFNDDKGMLLPYDAHVNLGNLITIAGYGQELKKENVDG